MTTKTKNNHSVAGDLISLVLQVLPAAYVVLTGQAPWWIRAWLATWLSLWLIMTVVQAAQKREQLRGAR
jgi:hypothetical protein